VSIVITCFVTGLAAHFAILLRLLNETTCEFKEENGQLVPEPYKSRLLGVLTARRSDLKKVEDTYTNSRTMIPYINRQDSRDVPRSGCYPVE
jgi:hypothetical protein